MKAILSKHPTLTASVVLVAIAGAVLGFSYWSQQRAYAKLTGEAPAAVTSVSVLSTRKGDSVRYRTTINYQFTVGGKVIQAKTTKPGDLRSNYHVGMQAKACYDPSNPEESEVFLADVKCGE